MFGLPVVEEKAAEGADSTDDDERDAGKVPLCESSGSDADIDGEPLDSALPQSRPNSVHLCGVLPAEPDHFVRRLTPTKTKGRDPWRDRLHRETCLDNIAPYPIYCGPGHAMANDTLYTCSQYM